VALAVTVTGTRDILGLWAGEHGDGEGAKYWLRVLSEIKNRGTADVCLVVCDGLKGLPEAIATVWPAAITQTCVVHLLRNVRREAPGLPNGGGRPSSPGRRSGLVKLAAA
jgi:putative transposase